jgi:eukaryotic-like serine/threonine-protein kinase
VYVQPFPGPGPKSRISRDGGSFPRWRGDGREIFFVTDERALMAVDVKADEAFTAGEPKPLFMARHKQSVYRDYDVTPDGRRFLVNVRSGDEAVAPITLVLNWTATLER